MSRRIDHIVSLKYGRRAAAGPLPPSRAAERPKQGFTRRFASTARLAMSNGYRRTTGSDREPEPDLSAQKEENRRRKKALSGTQWSLGSESDMAQWKQAVQPLAASTAGYDVPTPSERAEQKQVNLDRKKKLANRQWEYGTDDNTQRFVRPDADMATVADPRMKGGMTKQEMFDLKMRFKYGSSIPLGAGSGPEAVDDKLMLVTDEQMRQRAVADAPLAQMSAESRAIGVRNKQRGKNTTFSITHDNKDVTSQRARALLASRKHAVGEGDVGNTFDNARRLIEHNRKSHFTFGHDETRYDVSGEHQQLAEAALAISRRDPKSRERQLVKNKAAKMALTEDTIVIGDDPLWT